MRNLGKNKAGYQDTQTKYNRLRAERKTKMLLTGNFAYDIITFNGKKWLTRTIHVPTYGEVTIGDRDMEEELMNDGELVSDEARQIDDSIYYYVDGWKLRSFSDEELVKTVCKEGK